MRCRIPLPSLIVVALLIAANAAYAAAPLPQRREEKLPHVCKGGPNKGQACVEDTMCPTSTCKLKFLRGPDTTFEAKVTLIVDDDVSKFDGAQKIANVVAATVLLEIRERGETHFLAQTYQNLEGQDFQALIDALRQGPFLADTGSPLTNSRMTESTLMASLADNAARPLLGSFLFQEGDNEMANAVRALFGVTGRPVVADVPRDISFVQRSDHEADGLASLVRLRVKIRFIAP